MDVQFSANAGELTQAIDLLEVRVDEQIQLPVNFGNAVKAIQPLHATRYHHIPFDDRATGIILREGIHLALTEKADASGQTGGALCVYVNGDKAKPDTQQRGSLPGGTKGIRHVVDRFVPAKGKTIPSSEITIDLQMDEIGG